MKKKPSFGLLVYFMKNQKIIVHSEHTCAAIIGVSTRSKPTINPSYRPLNVATAFCILHI